MTHWRVSYFEEEQNSGAFIVLFNKIPKAFIKDDLFLPLWDDRFVLLEVERLSHDGKNVVHVLFLIKRGDMPMAMKNKDRHFISKQKYKNTETECTQLGGGLLACIVFIQRCYYLLLPLKSDVTITVNHTLIYLTWITEVPMSQSSIKRTKVPRNWNTTPIPMCKHNIKL